MGGVVARRRAWRFDRPAAVLWPILSDTARFNEAAGTPRYQIDERPRPDGSVLRLGRAVLGSGLLAKVRLEWEECPYEWVEGRSFRQRRRFRRGPFRSVGPNVTLEPDGAGARVSFALEVEPAGPFGRLLARLLLHRAGGTIERLVRDAVARQQPAAVPVAERFRPSPDTLERVAGMVATIEAGAHGHGLARRLADHVLGAPEVDLVRLRPLALARAWGVPERHAIELSLAAVRAGLLSLRWDLLCPRCRGAKATASSLDALPSGAHCPTCNIAYDRDFARNVELTMHPAPAVRRILAGEFCVASPVHTPHVRIQQTLAPGERRDLAAELPSGPYRLRTLAPGGSADVDLADGAALPSVLVSGTEVEAGPPAGAGRVRLENRGDREATVVIEDRAWVADALTAHRVTALAAFRDLFSDEVLRPGDEVEIGSVTLLFTDLKGSTALYGRVGDAHAYGLVRNHFAFLAGIVRDHDGAVVKTIGDAVMAAFAEPADALRAALAIQRGLQDFNRAAGTDALVIKIGIHGGPCVAVTLNGRLDYFGSAVNLAARLQDQSEGGDVVLSRALAADPAVAALLAPIAASAEQATIKGFGAPVAFVRLGGLADAAAGSPADAAPAGSVCDAATR